MGIGFVSLTEAFDMTTPRGRALAGMLAIFAEFERQILRERVKADIAQACAKGTTFGRPKSVARKTAEIKSIGSNARRSSRNPRLQDYSASAGPRCAASWRTTDRSIRLAFHTPLQRMFNSEANKCQRSEFVHNPTRLTNRWRICYHRQLAMFGGLD